jgi:uncharacterized phage-associated protein
VSQSQYGIREIANWILDLGERRGTAISNMALNKLLYFGYEHLLVKYHKKITNAKIEAWEHGPVFREIYRTFKEFGDRPITKRAEKYNPTTDKLELAVAEFDEIDREHLMEAIEPLIGLPPYILRELSHAADGPWDKTWNHVDKTNPGMEISDELIYRTFESRSVMQ